MRTRGAAEDARRDRRREETFVVGWAGQLTAIKRPLDLIRTLRALGARGSTRCSYSSGTARTGRTSRRSRAELEGGRKLPARWLPEEHPALVRVVRRLLLTSANEGTPVVAIEALAAGRPVVATRAGGTGAVVRNGESGYLEAVGDTAGWRGGLRPWRATRSCGRNSGSAGPRTSALGSQSGGWPTRSKRSTAGCSREGSPPSQADRRQRSGAHLLALLPALRARGVDARFLGLDVPGTDAPRFYAALDRAASRTVPSAAASTSALGWRATSSGRSGPSGLTSSTPISSTRTFTAARSPTCSGFRRSRPATTTTATCSAPSATSTVRLPGRRGA